MTVKIISQNSHPISVSSLPNYFFRRLKAYVKMKAFIVRIQSTNNQTNNFKNQSFGMKISKYVSSTIDKGEEYFDQKTLEKLLHLKLDKNSDGYCLDSLVPHNFYIFDKLCTHFDVTVKNSYTDETVIDCDHLGPRKLNKLLDYFSTETFLKKAKKIEAKQQKKIVNNVEAEARNELALNNKRNIIESIKEAEAII